MTFLFKLLLMILALRVGWGAWSWIKARSARPDVPHDIPGYDARKDDIEDAVFEEIPEERGNGS